MGARSMMIIITKTTSTAATTTTTTAAHTCENMSNSSADTKEAVQVASSEDEVADH